MKRVAVLSDVHGNLPALEAVLAEVDADAIVCCGDVSLGPMPAECLERLRALGAHFVRGNCDRSPGDEWVERQLTQEQLGFLRDLPTTVSLDVDGLGAVLFCHGSPRSDEEILTRISPESRVVDALAGVSEHVVVGGHTHVQYDREVGGHRLVNAGSVGMPYEGRQGAFWAMLGPDVDLRRTEYDVEPTAAVIEALGRKDHALWLREPRDPAQVSAYFESLEGA
ncbi:MAG: metallophosphoesterase family protein [Actinobacteria bacterium]|nr:metallophosphoesterase family protein [Actinomycetota bacterium]